MNSLKQTLTLLLLTALFCVSGQASTEKISSPQEVFGFRIGEDRKLIDWSQIVSYFNKVDEQSDRVIVKELGKSTLGKPFLAAIISSEQNIKKLARYQQIQRELAKPYTLSADAAAALIGEGKTVVLITLNIHSTEIAASQESVELLHEFATGNSPQQQRILENVIIVLVPSLNPDGQQLVVDWYRKTVGTPAEGTNPPELYHPYAGHDNNRDWFMYNLVESRHTARLLYHEWFPEIVFDQHQMGASGPRLFLPPYADPVNPNVHPLLTAQVNLLGKYMVTELQRQGFKGVVTGSVFNAYFEGTMSKTPLWHNRIGILSEMASAYLATPVFFPKNSLNGFGQELPENKTQTNYLEPWLGGWWRLRDIIDYEKAVTYSLLEFAAIFKSQVKTNFYNLNRESISRGQKEAPYGYLVPHDQHDPNATAEMINRLIIGGAEVTQTTMPLMINNRKIPAGSYYISLAQPARAYVKDLLEVQRYPDLKQYPGG
ncbi:MAG: M14 family metallopeptidase, partial [Acidobacteriota bacterium]